MGFIQSGLEAAGDALGLSSSSSSGPSSGASAAIDQQIRDNQFELESKKASLYRTRLDIIKGQGAQRWTPDFGSPLLPGHGGSPP